MSEGLSSEGLSSGEFSQKEFSTGTAVCLLCPQHCQLRPGQSGRCRARGNKEGAVVSFTYGEVAAMQLDPIEKKPLYHFYPGRDILSVAGYGCNLSCSFCQNYGISQTRLPGDRVSPGELAGLAGNSLGLCFTYSEPGVWYEMIRETAPLVKAQGGKVVLVSNGILTGAYLADLIPWIDAANIDIKGFNEAFYRRYCGGSLSWVLENVERLAGRVHLEVTTLIIPGANDDTGEIRALARWLEGLRVPVPWHLSRYFPAYRSNIPPTEPEALQALWQVARERLPYVYLGNVSGGSDTFCPHCGGKVIEREGYVVTNRLWNGHCSKCGTAVFGVGV
ncbi:Radical SAM [Acididesulfobacillus acetoxydans]|uniref:Radical SAM n=1 Tax=Acididesulfobacillus acetoxydans TaxID=1561005 RepID=A0A8S0X492_9FIRM|nr:AmmeMemoRadiSam system radical SAM enzyme [Acididesulfobacillus acetoxydans]CAA7600640.1 Radical SAM [Acididesulfobacillus acetoxydans]CEJ09421.1 Radical SAM super protein [Acididesulfobacillus acetoxydans]